MKQNNQDFEGEETLTSGQKSPDENEIYPDAVLNIARETASVFQLKRKWEKKPSMLNLTPPFQRDLVWTPKQKCELIESMIMGIPLPAFYVKEDLDGSYVVVDGKQRLDTLFSFINNEFRLKNLSILKNHNDKVFSDLTPLEQNKIEDYTLTVNVIKAPTCDRVTFDLFDRVNRGGTILNHQEMRNALYQGTSTKLLNDLAKEECFLKATERSLPSKHMKDKYLILRFLAFYLWQRNISKDVDNGQPLEYKSNIEDFLGKTMSYLNSLADTDPVIIELRNVFIECMDIASRFLVPLGGFRLPAEPGKNKRPINMAFYESFSCLIAGTRPEIKSEVSRARDFLFSNKEYMNSLTYSIDSAIQTQTRYDAITQYIQFQRANA